MAKKPDWLFRQSGAIPILNGQVVLITSRKSKRWIIPKGVIESNMSPWESAAKEAEEEGGIVGEIDSTELGSYQYHKWGGECNVLVYRLRVQTLLHEWEEQHMRSRGVFSPCEAVDLIESEVLRKLIRKSFQ